MVETEKEAEVYDIGQGVHYNLETFKIVELEQTYEPDRS